MSNVSASIIGRRTPLMKHPQEVQCPRCKLHTWTTLGELLANGVVICRGCHVNLRLSGEGAKARKLVRDFDAEIAGRFGGEY